MKTKNLNGIWCKKHILILFLVVAAALLGVFFFLRRGNGKAVILLPASRLDVPDTVCYYQQKDPRWAKDHLGQARDTMASSGCLVCALAAGLEMQDTSSLTPGELNRLFSEAQVYTDSGAVIWNRILHGSLAGCPGAGALGKIPEPGVCHAGGVQRVVEDGTDRCPRRCHHMTFAPIHTA